jgi:hypothetical protein
MTRLLSAFPRLAAGALAVGLGIATLMMAWLALTVLPPLGARHLLTAGRTHMKTNEPELALAAFQAYTRLRPHDPLGHLELGFALEQLCGGKRCQPALDAWRAGGVEPAQFVALGDDAMLAGDWENASAWYRRASMYSTDLAGTVSDPANLVLKRAIAGAISRHPDAEMYLQQMSERETGPVMYTVTDSLTLRGADLVWITPAGGSTVAIGTSLAYPTFDPTQEAGTLWWNGTAGALIEVQRAGRYSVRAMLAQGNPPPIDVQLGIDERNDAVTSLGRGDGMWAEIAFDADLDEGYHLVRVSFLNNDVVEGRDRNAVVKSVMVERQQ